MSDISTLGRCGEEKNRIIHVLNDYFKNRHDIVFAYLFGSFASGCENKLSDVDIAVYFSRDVLSSDIKRYLDMKIELEELLKREIDLVVLNTAKPLLKSRILNNRIKIISRDSLTEGEFISRSFGEYFDVAPYIEMQYRKAIAQMEGSMGDG